MTQHRLGSASSTVSSPRSSTSSVISPPSLGSLPSPPLENERTYAFAPMKAEPVDLEAQLKAFSFGTCPSQPSPAFLGTPTAELGPFEYPAQGISPPPTRRSSTCSTISTLPASGRRPSVIHSSTAPPDSLPSVADEDESASASPDVMPPRRRSSAQQRRPSIMFRQQGPIPPGPIPPSLRNFNLDRRGSLPISSLFPQPYITTTTELYARRNSSISSAGTGESSRTATANATRRGSLAVATPPPQSYFALRRQSVPHNLHSSLPYNPPSSSTSVRRISSPRASISLQERRALRSSVSAANPFVSSGSEDDSVEEEPELALASPPLVVEERPPMASHGSDGSTPTGSTETTVTTATLEERERVRKE